MTLAMVFASLVIAISTVMFIRKRTRRNEDLFKGKYIVITGGSQGLGEAIARQLCLKGECARRVSLWARGEHLLKQLSGELHGKTQVDYKLVDVTDYDQVANAVDADSDCPDIVFCCAGITLSWPTLIPYTSYKNE